MIDTTTNEPMSVETDGTEYPYVNVRVSQLPAVQNLLDSHKVAYWVEEIAISLDGEPLVAFVNFPWGTDPNGVQQILDGAP